MKDSVNSLKDQIERSKQQAAILRRCASDKLGKGYWGLTKKSDKKFSHEEILFLFARIYSQIGFDSTEEVRTTYPDVIAIKNGAKKEIELEPLLSSFKHHLKDDLSKCDYVVCWKDDIDKTHELRELLSANNIEVIELSQFYKLTKVKKTAPKSLVYSEKDIMNLKDGQLKVLATFITSNKTVLKKEEMKKLLGNPGKALGGWIGSFSAMARRKDWLVRTTPKGYEFKEKYKKMVKKVLEEFDYI